MTTHEFTVSGELAGNRLDKFLSLMLPGSSRSYLQKLIEDNRVRRNGETVTVPRLEVKENMLIAIDVPELKSVEIKAESFTYPVLFEDEFMLVINKPPGVVVHPAPGNPDGTVVNALLGRYPDLSDDFEENLRPGIVHRLDKDTSGCLVIAKTPDAQFQLSAAFARRSTQKTYRAVTVGKPKQDKGEIITLIGRHTVNRQKMAVVERNGKEAITRYRVIEHLHSGRISLAELEVDILTGRTHQIRVHLAHLKSPVLGDELYGGDKLKFPGIHRQMLHAWKLSLPHPKTGEMMHFCAPLPEDWPNLAELITTAL